MTINQLISNPKYSQKYILQKLICHFCKCTREDLYLQSDRAIDPEAEAKIISAYNEYVEHHKPLEYLLGEVSFFGVGFHVNEHTLIPRPETECMISAVTEYIQSQDKKNFNNRTLLDIGTGCGVLGTSVLLQNAEYFDQAIFTDITEGALNTAKGNFSRLVANPPKVEFFKTNLLEFRKQKKINVESNDQVVLVGNLPYIPEETFNNNVGDNVKNREPKMAFVGGDDGLIYYRETLDQVLDLHKTGLLPKKDQLIMFFEMMTWQMEILEKDYGNNFIFEQLKTFHFNIIILKAQMKS